jgi:hypothetical protein
MNKKIIISMSMPLAIENKEGEKATLQLNENLYIVCKFPNGELYLLKDVDIEGWYPSNKFRNFLYRIRVLIP